jgi:hypothetical protein
MAKGLSIPAGKILKWKKNKINFGLSASGGRIRRN